MGIDLSPQMADRAEARNGIYSRVLVGDLEESISVAAQSEALASEGQAFDLVLFADVLIYFGDLTEPLKHATAALAPKGLVGLTLERPSDADSVALDGETWKWKLEGSGRYFYRICISPTLHRAHSQKPYSTHAVHICLHFLFFLN